MSKMYSERLLDHYSNPRNKGRLTAPEFAAEEYNPLCGDKVAIEARVEAGRIVEATFEGRGCARCLGAASILTETIQGRTLEELKGLRQEAFLTELQCEPRASRVKCALLPSIAFRHAAYDDADWPLLDR